MNQAITIEKQWIFEDFIEGEMIATAARTITETDISLTVGITAHNQPLFTDEEFAKTTPYGTRIAPAELTIGILAGLLTRKGILENQIGLLELASTKFPNPMYAGDTVRAQTEIVGTRLTSNPERGIVTFQDKVFNQKGDVLLEQSRVAMFWARQRFTS